jgi:hypothetical protein
MTTKTMTIHSLLQFKTTNKATKMTMFQALLHHCSVRILTLQTKTVGRPDQMFQTNSQLHSSLPVAD